MELIQITNEILKVYKLMNQDIEELNKLTMFKSESEREYRKALSQEYMKLKAEGCQTTLIPDLAKGICSELLFNRDIYESKFMATKEAISVRQTQASLLQSILKFHEVI